jgi:hypothetical protein
VEEQQAGAHSSFRQTRTPGRQKADFHVVNLPAIAATRPLNSGPEDHDIAFAEPGIFDLVFVSGKLTHRERAGFQNAELDRSHSMQFITNADLGP